MSNVLVAKQFNSGDRRRNSDRVSDTCVTTYSLAVHRSADQKSHGELRFVQSAPLVWAAASLVTSRLTSFRFW
jgi:hypothetical protein